MSARFVIVDDDVGVCQILSNIITENGLGTVVAYCHDGLKAEKVISFNQPDIAIVDLLLPELDGLELVKRLRAGPIPVACVMISENRSQKLITQAYQYGVEFYIRKPVNVREIIAVINKVKESLNLNKVMDFIAHTSASRQVSKKPEFLSRKDPEDYSKKVNAIICDLGILSEVGTAAICEIAGIFGEKSQVASEYLLHEIFKNIAGKSSQDVKNIRQRVRRVIAKALHNLAANGLHNQECEHFRKYSQTLFDPMEVRKEMSYLSGMSPYHGKISIKKFIEGLVFLAKTG